MNKTKDLILAMLFGALLFGLGMWVGQSDTVVEAQGGEPRWTAVHGIYGEDNRKGSRYYIYTVDTWTGETKDFSQQVFND